MSPKTLENRPVQQQHMEANRPSKESNRPSKKWDIKSESTQVKFMVTGRLKGHFALERCVFHGRK
jgi:hypothetical protein